MYAGDDVAADLRRVFAGDHETAVGQRGYDRCRCVPCGDRVDEEIVSLRITVGAEQSRSIIGDTTRDPLPHDREPSAGQFRDDRLHYLRVDGRVDGKIVAEPGAGRIEQPRP